MARPLTGYSIFVLEHDAADACGLRTVLEAAGAGVAVASDPGEALVRLARLEVDAAILDGIDCAEICKALRSVPHLFYVQPHTAILADVRSVAKPATTAVIIKAVVALVSFRGKGKP